MTAPRPWRSGPCIQRAFSATTVAGLIFCVAAGWLYRDVLRDGPASHVPIVLPETFVDMAIGDVMIEAWLVTRNARTLARSPRRLFDAEFCAPMENSLTLGIPMITMGLLAVPVRFVSSHPAVVYNTAMVLVYLLSAMAMYLLVREWTGIPAAGIAAGLLYAFNPIRTGPISIHPSVWDASWFVFALLFAQRWFVAGRWRDAIGLGVACSLQIGASFYPFLAAFFFAPIYGAWLGVRYGFGKTRPAQWIAVAAMIVGAAIAVFGPYLDARAATGTILHHDTPYYFEWSYLLPDGRLYVGLGVVLFALLGLFAPRRSGSGIDADVRWPLGIGAAVVLVIAGGSSHDDALREFWADAPIRIPDFYHWIAGFVPGLDAVRGILRLTSVVLVSLCVLAGMGAAWLVRRFPERRLLASSAVIVIATFSVLPEATSWKALRVETSRETAEFFEELEKLGNRGPLFELPIVEGRTNLSENPRRALAVEVHGRRTSACYASYVSPLADTLRAISRKLPDAAAVEELLDLGFTTIVLHRSIPNLKREAERLRSAVDRQGDTAALEILHETDQMIAYALRVADRPAGEPEGADATIR
ncbi:MAG: hypothetical protein ACE5FL_07870 [Myxococcota bacterium]